MAAKFPSAGDVQLKPRKGHDMTWSCDDHGDPIKFYCKEHKIPVCHPCATKDHQKPCHLENIGDVILEMRIKLEGKMVELEEMMQRSNRLNSEIQSCSTFMSNHLEALNDEVGIAFEHKIKSVKDIERKEIASINEEADDQIRSINDTRMSRIRSSREKAEKKQQNLENTQTQLLADNKNIDATVGKKIIELKGKNQPIINILDNIGSKIRRINQDDKTLVNEAHQSIASIDAMENVHQDILDSLDHLKLEVQRVKFFDGRVGEDDNARIDGYIGKWEFVKGIPIPQTIHSTSISVPGWISNDQIGLLSQIDPYNKALYVSNTSTGHTYEGMKGQSNTMRITSCAPVDKNLIVCGNVSRCDSRASPNWHIPVYDRQWKLVKHIKIPWNRPMMTTPRVDVDVDKDGMVLAGEWFQSNIYVINPADDTIVHTITMHGNQVRGRIQALSSGDIIMRTNNGDRFTVFSRLGEEKAVIQFVEWDPSYISCRTDILTDTLYITYWDEDNRLHAVDQVSCDGVIQARKIVEYKLSDLCSTYIPSIISPSGDLVTCTGEVISIYKKIFVV